MSIGKLTPSEAFALLGLTDSADEGTVREAYRRLSLQTHPDRPGGDSDQQSRLNEAYAVALAVVAPQNAITLRAASSIQRVE